MDQEQKMNGDEQKETSAISKSDLPNIAISTTSSALSSDTNGKGSSTNGTSSREATVPLNDARVDGTSATVETIKKYIKKDMIKDALNEDKFCIEMIELDRISTDRLRYRPDSDNPKAYEEEVGFSQDQEFFKELCLKTGADKRTINWMRRKIGWNELTEISGRLSDDSDDDGESQMKRKTRGSRRTSAKRAQAAESQGVHALGLAVLDLEQEFGAFKKPRPEKVITSTLGLFCLAIKLI